MHSMITDGIANLSILACMAFFTGCIVALLQRFSWATRIPSPVLCAAVSIVLCVVGYILYSLYAGLPVVWYLVGDASLAGCVVAVLTVYGMTILKDISGKK